MTPERLLYQAFWRFVAAKVAPFLPPRRPGPFTLRITAQESAAVMKITASLPEKTASDVATFELNYQIDGSETVVATSTGDPIEFSAPVGSTVTATFVEVDGSGNRSEPSDEVSLAVVDSIAPPKPGVFGLVVSGQDE